MQNKFLICITHLLQLILLKKLFNIKIKDIIKFIFATNKIKNNIAIENGLRDIIPILSNFINKNIATKEYFIEHFNDSFESPSLTLQFLSTVCFGTLSAFNIHSILLGAKTNVRKIKVKNNQPYKLLLENEIGDGHLIYITYTPRLPSNFENSKEFYTFFSEYTNHNLSHKNNEKILFFISKNPKNIHSEIEIDISYTYLPFNFKENPITEYLLSAFTKYSEQEYDDMILKLYLSSFLLNRTIIKSLKENNINDKITSTEQLLKIYIDKLLNQKNNILIPPFILKELKNIQEIRKEIMHEGIISTNITKEMAKNFIISTYLFYKYCENILQLKLFLVDKNMKTGPFKIIYHKILSYFYNK